MGIKKNLSRLYCSLFLIAGLGLAACGDNTVTTTPAITSANPTTPAAANPTTAPATAPVATSPANTTAATTTVSTTAAASATTTAATTATTTPAGTTRAATTGVATTAPAPTGSSQLEELFSIIPNTPGNLKELKYNNYAALRSLYKIPADATFQSLQQDKELFQRYLAATRFLDSASVLQVNYFQTLRATAGYDLLQADYDAQAGLPPNYLSLAQGNFDNDAIDKLWSASGATKAKVGPNNAYTFEKLNLNDPLQKIFLGPLTLIPVPDRKLLVLGKQPEAAKAVVENMPTKTPIKDNPGVKAMLAAFGDPLALYLSSQVAGPANISPNSSAAEIQATIKARTDVPIPPALLGGFAYYADSAGAGTYLVANYYPDEASAKTAQPLLENQLRTGTSLRTKTPYSDFWEVVSSETRGNLLLFKLNWKRPTPLNQFVYNRDFPAFQN
jgi:hypothetical protein